ncbi:MAG TPA: transcriptional repressor LexA [Candidatus Paceibacterota bacterium]
MNTTDKNDLRGYAFLRNQIMHSGTTPSLREIGKAVGYASPRSVQLMLERLKKRGFISYINGVIKLSPNKAPMSERTVDVPLVGSVACGSPTLAEQDVEAFIPISTRIAKPNHTYFLLRATGSSMNKSGIDNGDLLLVRQESTAEEGEKVVALINDDATVKHIHYGDDVIVLKPHSTKKEYKPIVLSDDFMIQGVVDAVFPKNTI